MTTETEWTIMVYLAGDNDLPAFCMSVLQQMEAVNYPDEVCVLACFDSSVPWSKGSRYFRVNCKHGRFREETVDWDIHNDLVVPPRRRPVPGDSDEGITNEFYRPVVSEGLRLFVEWSVKNHPNSEKFMLVLFGHGLAVGGQDFLITENPPSFLTVKDLQGILSGSFKGNRKLDVLALQNCVMNGIEMAYALRDDVDLMIGSQDLVLAMGWPYEKLLSAVVEKPSDTPTEVAEKLLRLCARNMLDFSIMDRSSEQSVFDLKPLRDSEGILKDVKALADTLIKALDFKIEYKPPASESEAESKQLAPGSKVPSKQLVLLHPAICDATRLARLDAQAFWNESYVDLFDFCERLIKKCNEAVKTQSKLLTELDLEAEPQPKLRESPLVETARKIIECCKKILDREKELIPISYYIGPELQYSRGVSIYFPWTKPGAPYFPVAEPGGLSFRLKSTYDIYQEYEFVQQSNWAKFLDAFFMATLRNMRRAERTFIDLAANESLGLGLIAERYEPQSNFKSGDLARTSPNTGKANYDHSSNVKNYPRRNYLSPVDEPESIKEASTIDAGTGKFPEPESPPASALGWNITGLVTSLIEKKPVPSSPSQTGSQKDVDEK